MVSDRGRFEVRNPLAGDTQPDLQDEKIKLAPNEELIAASELEVRDALDELPSLAKLFGLSVGPRVHPFTPQTNCSMPELYMLQPTNRTGLVNEINPYT
jgi:hypothetical protein